MPRAGAAARRLPIQLDELCHDIGEIASVGSAIEVVSSRSGCDGKSGRDQFGPTYPRSGGPRLPVTRLCYGSRRDARKLPR